MKTQMKTGGFGGGLADARTARPRRRAAVVLPRARGPRYRVAAKKDARPVLQHRTGASNGSRQMTRKSIALLPRVLRGALAASLALTLSGVLPMALAALLMQALEVAGWWLLVPIYALLGYAAWLVMTRDAG